MSKIVIKILQVNAAVQNVLGGLTIYHLFAIFLPHVCQKLWISVVTENKVDPFWDTAYTYEYLWFMYIQTNVVCCRSV